MESLVIHLKQSGYLEESDRDLIYRNAIDAHLAAEEEAHDPAHVSVAALLRMLHRRSDGLKVIGDFDPDPPGEG